MDCESPAAAFANAALLRGNGTRTNQLPSSAVDSRLSHGKLQQAVVIQVPPAAGDIRKYVKGEMP
ncbi:MAG: hypothetical protein NWS48_09280 [Akkermansiaceae bacterium]|nr:hypothetical protein [Akkermansiaceae bacterium]MDP4779047.1 hypothetical protein [Akkermansiaceae bacterium]